MQIQYLINGRHDNGLSPMDRGLAYGDGVFRTIPLRHGELDCWDAHYRRLSDDCNALSIVCPPAAQLKSDISQLCAAKESAVLKIIVTRGESARGYAVPALAQPNRVLIKSPMPTYPEQNYSDGVRLFLCHLRLSLQPRLAGIKHLNRLENVLARMEWTDGQYADGLLLDADDRVIECTMSNIFIRNGSTLITPDLTRCGVAGVTRQRIIELAPVIGYKAEVLPLDLEVLLSADEVVICNSLFGVWQVRQLLEKTWPAGPLAGQLRLQLEQADATVA